MEQEEDFSSINDEDFINDVVDVDFNIIPYLQQQLQLRTKVNMMIMLCIIGYVLRILNLSQITTNTPRDFVPQKEHRKEQLMSYLVHTNQCRNTICMGLEAFINLCQRLRAIGLVKNAF